MKFRYIGTAAAEGIPSIYCDCPVCRNARQNGGKDIRARSGAVIDETLLIDYPPDIYMQCLNGLLDARLIRSVLITHAHADHCDMYELMFRSDPYFCLPSCEYTLHIYGNAAARHRFDEACRETPINHVEFHIINPYSPFLVQGFTVTALPANHAYEQAAFIFLLEKDGKYGYYDYKTCWIADPVLRDAEPFCEGLAVVRAENGKKGVLNTEGHYVLPAVFDEIFYGTDGLIVTYERAHGWSIFWKMEK